MYTINENYLDLQGSYLFSTIAKKVNEYKENNPQADIIRLGIGDVTKPIVPAIIEALHKAVDEMGTSEGFHGYGPEQGYDFLKNAIADKPPARPSNPSVKLTALVVATNINRIKIP